MAVRANASRLVARMRRFISKVQNVEEAILPEVEEDLIDRIERNLLSSNYQVQVGFDPHQFIRNLRATSHVDPTGRLVIDPMLAGGSEADLEEITGVRIPTQNFGRHRTTSLWHEHKLRGEAFYRFVYSRPDAKSEIAAARQRIWGGKTPQWFLIEFGTTGANPPQTAQRFIERASEPATTRELLKARFRQYLRDE